MTMIEVVVGMLLLAAGVLGTLTMVDTGNRATADTMAREAATNVAREITERAREIPYATLGTPSAASALSQALGLGAQPSGATSFPVQRRNVGYTVAVSSCALDDPSDGIGAVDPSFCAYNPAAGGGTMVDSTGATVAANLQVLGIPLNIGVGGTVATTVCNLLGTNPPLADALGSSADALLRLVRGGADLDVCPGTSRRIALDDTPDDLKRLTVTVTWNRRQGQVVQATIVPNPGNGATA